jgi:hypothetical protein
MSINDNEFIFRMRKAIFTMISRTLVLLLALFATASAFVPAQNAGT